MKKIDDTTTEKEVQNELEIRNKTTKAPKQEKQIKAKKLPRILKKKYTQKKLDKFLKRIYIPTHKEMVQKLFVPYPKKSDRFYIPRDLLIPKSQFKKLKKIAKDVSSQKLSFKLIPFAAVVAFFAATIIVVCTFKNVVAKKAIVAAMQSAFGAKTSIQYVNVQIFGSSINIKKIEQGYKEDPMKNLFELDQVLIDFNLTELLRGKFDLQNIAVEGINVMTPRKTSAALEQKIKKQKKQKEKKEAEQKSAMQIALENKAAVAQEASMQELQKLFAQYNPENVLKNLEAQLASPIVAKEVYEQGDALVQKWISKPDEITSKVNSLTEKVNTLVNTDWSKVDDAKKIKSAIENITSTIQEGKSLANETKSIVDDVKSDSKSIKDASVKIKNALEKDKSFVDGELKKIKSFSINDGVQLLSGPIENVMYKTAGKYYPYLKKGVNLAMQAKASSSSKEKTEKKEKVKKEKSTRKRLAGRNIYYRKNNVPKFLIEKMSVSGVNWSGLATNISSDMDKRGEPAFAQTKMQINGQDHCGDITVDTRIVTDKPLVQINYSGTNYPIGFSVSEFALNSTSLIKAKSTILTDGTVFLGATVDMNNVSFKTAKFEPEFAYNLYSRAINNFIQVSIGVEFTVSPTEKFDLKIFSDADKQFAKMLKKFVNDELETLKQDAKVQITKLLDEQTGGATSKIKEFVDIENGISKESVKVDKLNKLLEDTKKQLEEQLKQELKSQIQNSEAGKILNSFEKIKLF